MRLLRTALALLLAHAAAGLLILGLAPRASAQPTPTPTNTSLTVNATTSAITAPGNATRFASANGLPTLSGSNTFLTGATATFNAGSTLTLNGALAGTPSGGTLSLANLTLTLGTSQIAQASVAKPPSRAAVTIVSDATYNAFPGLTIMANGAHIVVYRKGTSHASDVGVIVKRTSTDSGATWSGETTIVTNVLDVRDPSITRLADGSLIVSYFTASAPSTFATYVIKSTDNGATWSSAVDVGGYTTWSAVSAPVVQLANGNLLLPTYGYDATWKMKVHRSTDGGATWSVLSTLVTSPDYAEPVLLLLANGNLLGLLNHGDALATTISTDSGATWGTISDRFAMGSCAPRAYQFTAGTIVTAYRSSTVPNVGALAYRSSADSGVTWSNEIIDGIAQRETMEYAAFVARDARSAFVAYGAQKSSSDSAIYHRIITDAELDGPLPMLNAAGLNAVDGDIALTNGRIMFADGARSVFMSGNATGTGSLTFQAGAGSGAWGGALRLHAAAHATRPGWVTVGLGSSGARKFTINDDGLAAGTDVFTVDFAGITQANGYIRTAGTAGAGFFEGTNQSAAPGTPTSAGRMYWDASNRPTWKGTNGYTYTLDATANTAARLYTLPNADGDIAVLGVNGIPVKSAASTWVARTMTGTTNQITVTNGDGIAGNPTFSLPQNIHTAATPTFAGATLNGHVALSDASSSGTRLIYMGSNGTATGSLAMQAGGGSPAWGGTLQLYAGGHATRPGWVTLGSSVSGAKFTINSVGYGGDTSSDVVTVDRSGSGIFAGTVTAASLATAQTPSSSVATASTHKVAIVLNGTTYYMLLTNVP